MDILKIESVSNIKIKIFIIIMSPPKKKKRTNTSVQTDLEPINLFDLINSENFYEYKDDNDNESETETESEDESEWEYKIIDQEIKNIDDLITLGKIYNFEDKIQYNINLKKLSKLVKPLEKLQSMIGLTNIKQNIVGHIIYHLQNLEDGNNDMLHTVIQGSPGVGKTMLGKILGDIYFNLGILKGNPKKRKRHKIEEPYTFKIVKRSDLIGKYLGHTAAKTQKVIDECHGGVLFIDEAYSLGNPEGRDSFSKECIDTLNQNLTEGKSNFLCIIAGYKNALETCFFAYNEGLRRRFTFIYDIENYTAHELMLIFKKMVFALNWSIDEKDDILVKFFKDNYNSFKCFGGDVETLFFNCKIEHGKRVFCHPELKKKLNSEDIKNGFKNFTKNRSIKSKESNLLHTMYI